MTVYVFMLFLVKTKANIIFTGLKLCFLFSGTPAPPSIPRITDTHADSISLAWSRPVEDGGADVIGYILEMQVIGAEEWQKAHEKTLRATDYVVTGLSAGKKYCFRVAGINVNGTGDFSEPCAETEPVERIGKLFEVNLQLQHKIFANQSEIEKFI